MVVKNNRLLDLISPFQWRYGSPEIRKVWAEKEKRVIWRKIWLEHLKALNTLIGGKMESNLDSAIVNQVNLKASMKIEEKVKHDLFAELAVFTKQLPAELRRLAHFGLTSADVEENCDAVRLRESLKIILPKFARLLEILAARADQTKRLPALGYTHLMRAEPITYGQRFAYYLQDLLIDFEAIKRAYHLIHGKGLRGVVGNAACLVFTLGERKWKRLEDAVMNMLNLHPFDISTQTPSRKIETHIIMLISSLSSSIHKIAFDLRILSSKGEVEEPFDYSSQVGSSAMPFKVNPVKCEQVCSLSRFIMVLSQLQLQNTSVNLLERTLDESANRRIMFPEIFIALDHCLSTLWRIISDLKINIDGINHNLTLHSAFALEALKALLMLSGYSHGKAYAKSREIWLESIRTQRTVENIVSKGDLLPQNLQKKFEKICGRPDRYIGISVESVNKVIQRTKRALKRFYESWQE